MIKLKCKCCEESALGESVVMSCFMRGIFEEYIQSKPKRSSGYLKMRVNFSQAEKILCENFQWRGKGTLKGCETVATRTQGGWRRVIQAETVKVAEPDHRGPGGG